MSHRSPEVLNLKSLSHACICHQELLLNEISFFLIFFFFQPIENKKLREQKQSHAHKNVSISIMYNLSIFWKFRITSTPKTRIFIFFVGSAKEENILNLMRVHRGKGGRREGNKGQEAQLPKINNSAIITLITLGS